MTTGSAFAALAGLVALGLVGSFVGERLARRQHNAGLLGQERETVSMTPETRNLAERVAREAGSPDRWSNS